MTVQPPSAPDAAEVATLVERAQEALAEGVDRADLRRDPLRHVLVAFSAVIEIFPGLARSLEASAERARAPVDPAQEEALMRRVVEATSRSIRQEAPGLHRAFNRRTAALVGVAVAAAGLVGAGGGFLLGRSSAADDVRAVEAQLALRADAARAWAELLRANPDPRPALAAARTWRDGASDRRVAEVRLWLDPVSAVAPAAR